MIANYELFQYASINIFIAYRVVSLKNCFIFFVYFFSCYGIVFPDRSFFKTSAIRDLGGVDWATSQRLLPLKNEKKLNTSGDSGYQCRMTSFCRHSFRAKELAKALTNEKTGALSFGPGTSYALDPVNFVYHDSTTALPGMSGVITLNPQESINGVRWVLHNYLGNFFYQLQVTAVHVHHALGIDLQVDRLDPTTQRSGFAYFQGGLKTSDQAALLSHGKFTDITTGQFISDLIFTFGFDHEYDRARFGALCKFYLPCRSEAKSKDFFEPLCGNGEHFGFEFGARCLVPVIKTDSYATGFWARVSGAIFLPAAEQRILGLREQTGEGVLEPSWGHYFLIAAENDSVFSPAANLFSRSVSIKPGEELSADVNYFLESHDYSCNLGYRAWVKLGETMGNLKSNTTAYRTINAPGSLFFIEPNTKIALIPDAITHTISCECIIFAKEDPYSLRAGLSYEVGSSDRAWNGLLSWIGFAATF